MLREDAAASRALGGAARFMATQFFDFLEAMTGYANDHGRSMLELAFTWQASHPRITSVIAGLTKPEYAAQNAKAGEWRLTPAQQPK